jgi:hypothetical protein
MKFKILRKLVRLDRWAENYVPLTGRTTWSGKKASYWESLYMGTLVNVFWVPLEIWVTIKPPIVAIFFSLFEMVGGLFGMLFGRLAILISGLIGRLAKK